ncbi:NAD(P)-binding protein [Aureobasidium pullulans]|uniref:NAD(P)-binding protein n=1 Tax=Aureobasidium pullulans TaxID=5580 RepID=A0AB74JFF8_AURPU|nr:NAD(P)-binding protein [Aureobasidium pullulans]THX21896.1 NAD(P)-binding protein [Aureobasidium pullulans]
MLSSRYGECIYLKKSLEYSHVKYRIKIRAVTRDNSKPSAKALAEKGAELVNPLPRSKLFLQADLNSKESVPKIIQGSHTVFLVTNYWETMDPKVEVTQGKNVADAAKEAGVSHIIFSSLLNVTEATNGRLVHVPHFDGKADTEKHIRSTGVPCIFMLPGYFMSNLTDMMQKGEDGSFTLAYPTSDEAKFPLFDAAQDTGKFVKAIIKNSRKLNGKQILAATAYYTPKEILSTVSEATGKSTHFASVTPEQYKSFLPEAIAEEMLENHLFVEKPGYYNGAELDESLSILEDKPTTWKDLVVKSGAFK